MVRPGSQPSCIAWRVIENEPVMMAWLAMMVATVASSTIGYTDQAGAIRKNGLPVTSPLSSSNAV